MCTDDDQIRSNPIKLNQLNNVEIIKQCHERVKSIDYTLRVGGCRPSMMFSSRSGRCSRRYVFKSPLAISSMMTRVGWAFETTPSSLTTWWELNSLQQSNGKYAINSSCFLFPSGFVSFLLHDGGFVEELDALGDRGLVVDGFDGAFGFRLLVDDVADDAFVDHAEGSLAQLSQEVHVVASHFPAVDFVL